MWSIFVASALTAGGLSVSVASAMEAIPLSSLAAPQETVAATGAIGGTAGPRRPRVGVDLPPRVGVGEGHHARSALEPAAVERSDGSSEMIENSSDYSLMPEPQKSELLFSLFFTKS